MINKDKRIAVGVSKSAPTTRRISCFPSLEAAQIDSWPEELRKKVKPVFENPPKANVDKTVDDGEELPYCGGITVIHTPGHTPGHICLYLKQSKTLITGDAMNVVDGQLLGPVPQYAHDIETATKSLKKLARYEIETVISYHGGVYKGNVKQRIAELTDGVKGKQGK